MTNSNKQLEVVREKRLAIIHMAAALEVDDAAFNGKLVELKWESRSENDEGDYDSYTTSILTYGGHEIWRKATASHSNIGGAWGSEHTAVLSENKRTLVVTVSEVGGTVASGGRNATAEEPETLDVESLVATFAAAASTK